MTSLGVQNVLCITELKNIEWPDGLVGFGVDSHDMGLIFTVACERVSAIPQS